MQVSHIKPYTLIILLLLLELFSGCTHSSKSQSRRQYSYKSPSGVYHTVQKGQSLWRIAKTYGVSLEDIARANNISDPNLIEEGMQLYIPGADRELPVEVGEAKISRERPKPKNRRKVSKEPDYPPFKGNFIWPVKGTLPAVSEEDSAPDGGLNILAPAGADIRAAAPGRVVYSDNKMNFYGNMIIIKHQPPYFTIYAHNAENLVKTDDVVTQGQVIARVGQTGRIGAPCLHFEIRKGEEPLNPLPFLPKLE